MSEVPQEEVEKKGHPPGLYVLFSTEAAERFSFYTMRALLVLYLTSVIFISQFGESFEQREELLAEVHDTPHMVLDWSLEQMDKEQEAALEETLRVMGTDAVAVFDAALQVAEPEDLVERAFTDLTPNPDALFPSAIEKLSSDPQPFAEWVLKERIKKKIRDEALHVYGLYLLLVYLSGLIGGYFADKVLGSRKAIIAGGIVMGLGLFVMGIPGNTSLFYGLGLIVAGNGFFKPNISTIVSGLYEEKDKRRDAAFTIFYMGINLGAFLAIFGAGLAEALAKTYSWGWNTGFVIAGVGMVFSLALFQWGQKYLGKAGFPPGREVTPETRLQMSDYRDILVWSAGITAVVVAFVSAWGFIGPIWKGLPLWGKLLGAGVLIAAALLRNRFAKKDASHQPLSVEEWQRVAVIIILSVFVIFFWAGFEQAGGTMNLFAYEQTDRHIGGWEMPATWFQGFNPVFIVLLAPLFSILWGWNDKQKWGLPVPAKMGVGMIVLGVGFIVMYYGQLAADTHGEAAMTWLIAVYLLHTMGELCLSPIGLSMVTKLSPVRIVSLMMGVWFACTAVADYLSGRLEYICHTYDLGLWSTLIATSVGAGIVLLAITPLLTRWMHGRA
jgi:POT family proton-dependent oligopeptide transporter